MSEKKEIRYLNRDFASFRESLMSFAKVYFPTTYRDFNELSPGMMMIEMVAYAGDVLSFYTDKQFRESLFMYADERETVLNFSYLLGYRPKVSVPATAILDFFQIVPSIGAGAVNAPDWRYAVKISAGAIIGSSTTSTVSFRTLDDIDFATSSSATPTTVTVYSVNGTEPNYYLLKKSVGSIAGNLKTETFSFSEPEKFAKIVLGDAQISNIYSVTDSDGNTWYEVPYLAQDTIMLSVPNTSVYDPALQIYKEDVPYLLKLKKVPRRFEVRVRADNQTELRFGSGISDSPDEEIIPNMSLLSSPLPGGTVNFTQTIDPTNFLFTRTYGQVPHNTTMTVRYYSGGGLEFNVSKDDLTKLLELVTTFATTGLSADIMQQVRGSLACINPEPATGGKGAESIDEIKRNAMAQYASQNRAVTKDDYIIRTLALPARYGGVAKAYILQDTQMDASMTARIENPLALNLFVLGFDNTGKFRTLNTAIKENLRVYLNQYRMLTDAVNIRDAFVVNIGVDFKIVVFPKYNKNEVLLRAIANVKSIFENDKWQINQPIILNDIINAIASTEGVQSVPGKPDIICKWKISDGYSGNYYDILNATEKDVIYPPMDPSVFEVKFPDVDIRGQVDVY